MKSIKSYFCIVLLFLLWGCSEDTMDRINKDLNDATDVPAINELPDVIVESAFGTTGTDMAWYASLFIEQSAGTDEQFYDADRRQGVTASSLMNNSWNAVYDNLMVLQDMINKCSPDGSEPDNKGVLGIAQVLTAYNLAIVTDMWGSVPWTEALQGEENVHPKYDSQEDVYQDVFELLNKAISNFQNASDLDDGAQDLLYAGKIDKWKKAAWSLKARYFMHLERVNSNALDSVLNCIPKGFNGGGDALVFDKYEPTGSGGNPWAYFTAFSRGDLCAGETLYDLMEDRSDPRILTYFQSPDGTGSNNIVPAPNGEADRTRAGFGKYSFSKITGDGTDANLTAPTPMMTYFELEFLKAEAQARKGENFKSTLKEAIEANFDYHGLDVADADAYFTAEVEPKLGISQDDDLKAIMIQKYIASYEQSSIEAYNDYRRTRIPELHNPANSLSNYGFVERFPYPSSEVTANPDNVPNVNVFKDKIWWAK